MARSTKFYGDWREHDGKVVKIDGIAYRLVCRVYTQRYPYTEEVIDVSAVPVNKRSKNYRETRSQLGDDWVTDLLAYDCEQQADIVAQLAAVAV